ncbi:MAG: type II secretion system protein GspK [Deltaproteobacteria bacterium]|nr:type II secretion system protein GspK [Deltaproteobacteria bacterium]
MNSRTRLRDNDGFALILTILIVSLILVLTLQFSRSVRCALYSSVNLKDGIRVGYMARSGFNCALALLSEDAANNALDSLLEPWANAMRLSDYSTRMFDNGRFELDIVDLSGKIQINRLIEKDGTFNDGQRAVLLRFLSSAPFALDADTAENLVDAIKDWIDPDSEPTRFGAETSTYQGLDPPRICKNGPLEAMGELLWVKGMTRKLLYGTGELPGISDYLTVHGEGPINVNTADPLILKSLSEAMDASLVEAMDEYRKNESNDLKDENWYKNVSGMAHITIDPALITTKSHHFKIRSTGVSGTLKKVVLGIVKREDKKSVKTLVWRIE